ncbi:MAG TPA: alpha/beta hydrolase, partial [Anaerolineales bacterium]|nr:alpha/beta hydrolase [Anaerolineales bacterium]
MSRLNQQFQLPDGRRLGYDERGVPDGTPIFYFHGSPSSRLEAALYLSDDLLESRNVRLIAVDRPGLGLSDFQPNRRLLDWPQDVLSLADHLKIERFAILAYSLGGPYGLACAFAIPQRLAKVGIVSGAALFTVPELVKNINEGTRRFLTMPREKPWLSRLFLWTALGVMPRIAPNRFIAQANSLLPEPDRRIVVDDPEFQEGFLRMVREAMRQGTRGAFHESLLTITNWGFRSQEINTPVLLWHGEADQSIPVEMARFAASAIPQCDARFYPEEGHLSLFKKHVEEIIHTL